MSIFDISTTEQIKSLRVACIMDEFSFETFRYDCEMLQLTPQHWNEELSSFKPELLFVESAWRGKDNLWANKVFSTSSSLPNIVKWCNANNIPTVFWNKEDPVNFESFTHGMGVTQLFDYIFTTDVDSICRYKKLLQHNNIFLLPFTVQPTLHNPIEEYQREDGVCFAGSYYCKYPQRAADFKIIYDTVLKYKPVTIYDRNHTRGDKQFQFPDHYLPSIKGFLPFSEIGKGYKGYNYGITLNSVTRSQTMFARRALELIACNTSVISNYSRSLRLFFGKAITMLGDPAEFENELSDLFEASKLHNKSKYQLLTHVMNELSSTAGLRLVVEVITGKKLRDEHSSICCVAHIHSAQEFSSVYQSFLRQKTPNKTLLIVANSSFAQATTELNDVEFCDFSQLHNCAKSILQKFDFIAKFDPRDFYGEQYLADSIVAQKYRAQTITCKAPHYEANCAGQISLTSNQLPYVWISDFLTSAAVFPTSTLSDNELPDLILQDRWQNRNCSALALDVFNYCRLGADWEHSLTDILVPEDKTSFITMNKLHEMALNTSSDFKQVYDLVKFDGDKLLKSFTQVKPKIELNLNSWPIRLTSQLDLEKHDYINSDTLLDLNDLLQDGKLKFWLNASYRCDLLLDIWFYDNQGNDVGRAIYPPNSSITYLPPAEAVKVKFALRVKGPGEATLFEFLTGTRVFLPDAILNLNPILYVTDSLSKDDKATIPNEADIFIFTTDIDYEYGRFNSSETVTGGKLLFDALMMGSNYEKIVCNSSLKDRLCREYPGIQSQIHTDF